ncbi:NADPH-dependent assimilatory sulfite reductase hemoprotein subunit [Limnoglobus roseus]|uniref:NADPH-dependent assimilatory sulfite reductase hemoprotein subunit n=1 Tax=Limnoglobus roseus TaxID=2598579 RepID=A0A5C1AHI3_9BACT|nr:NADPH-dependent assimilatory sulfite reductase hemoprotein subunit [Limnoglobus roseus]QEL18095.1 NADPH-dependent assimilatory sulfite reductase hemoprotein subunit [Limnoglobus roseus]
MSNDNVPKPSPVEGIKTSSRFLRGTLAEELVSGADHFSNESMQLLKFHGSYQQEDRDARKKRDKPAGSKAYMFMIRLKLPGGKLTSAQYLAMDDICGKFANGTLRLTTRQSIQFHGILMGNLKNSIAEMNAAFVSTLGACGDVNRNVVCCPAPTGDATRVQMQELADKVAAHLAPRAGGGSYHEIWLNGEKQETLPEPEVAEPIYGNIYLPRKFKIGFALPDDNCIDILAQCLGFLAIRENGQPIGYNMYVGGGQGNSNAKPDTYPLIGQAACFLTPDEVVEAAEAVVRLYRDHGNRSDRKRARFKYVVHDWGIEKFREVFERDYWKKPLKPVREAQIANVDLHLGWHKQANGKFFLGISVENGRIKDEGNYRLRSGLRAIVSKFDCLVRISTQQDILLGEIDGANKSAIDSLLNEYGIPKPENLSMVQKWSMACPAIPTCGLAISESERSLPGLVDQLEPILTELGLADEQISVRMTGCPNGCARPFQSEIGLVGRAGPKYTMYIGGDSFGRRLNFELQDSVPIDQIPAKLGNIFKAFKAERQDGELFGDFCYRLGLNRLQELVGPVLK